MIADHDIFAREYSTSHEKQFLDGLGSHRSSTAKNNLHKLPETVRRAVIRRLSRERNSYAYRRRRQVMSKTDLLLSYLSAASRRRQWGEVDGIEVVKHAKQLLERSRHKDENNDG